MTRRPSIRTAGAAAFRAALAVLLLSGPGHRLAAWPAPAEAAAPETGAAPGGGGAEAVPEAGPAPVRTLFVRPIAAAEPGSHDANPTWSPDGALIAFERSRGESREIVIARAGDGTIVETVRRVGAGEPAAAPFPVPGLLPAEEAFNAGTTWSPSGRRIVFMSNGGEGNYDLYIRELGASASRRLTEHAEKDGHTHWSPTAEDFIVYVSGRTGRGDLYLLDLASRRSERISKGGQGFLYPRWSPDGRRIAVTHGRNENHDILVIEDVACPRERIRALSTWRWDDLRPAWSPDGRRIAFYSNFNEAGDPSTWCIVVVDAAGADPAEGPGLAARIVAREVVPDVETGPAWTPDGGAIVFVKDARREYNPIYVAEIAARVERPVLTGTKMNHDVACGPDGLIAFRAQVDQWDRLFVAKLDRRALP